MSPASMCAVPALVVVAAEDLFSCEADWLQQIACVMREATVYPSGSVALQLRPRLAGHPDHPTGNRPEDCRGACRIRIQKILEDMDPGKRLPIYASARHAWVRADAAWRVHVPEEQIQSALTRTAPAWSASVHSAAAAQLAERSGAHMVLVAPVFAPTWKPATPIGLDGLAAIVAACQVPVLSLGGISAERVRGCLDAGAVGVAVASSVMLAADVGSVLHAYADALGLPAGVRRD